MTLKLNERYPARFNNPSADYPQGSFKNRTTPTARDGSYLEQDWANDKEGFFQSLIAAAAIAPNGSVDKVGASQMYDALVKIIGSTAVGRLLNVRIVTASGTITKTPGANKWRVRGVAPGGAGGGTQATGASQAAAGGGGSAGAYGEGLYDVSAITSVVAVIGTPGLGVAGANGNNATSSSLGSLMTLPGGNGGLVGPAVSSFAQQGGNPAARSAAPSGANIIGIQGDGGLSGKTYQAASSEGGQGGKSPLGSVDSGSASVGFGSGGTGRQASASTGAGAGYAGAPSIFIIEEYA